jgi:DNA-binding NarL/FixJ family response regulator
VLFTVIDASPMVRLGLSFGAHGYVLKEDAADELVPAVQAALEGGR